MEKVLFPQLAPEARLEAIKKSAKSSEELTFTRHLSDAEIDAESRRLAKLVKDLTDVEEEKAAAAKEYGDQIKSIKELMKDSSKTISKGEKEVTEKVYKFINYDTQEVMFYDSYGNLAKCRKAMMDELQMDMYGNGDIEGQQTMALIEGQQTMALIEGQQTMALEHKEESQEAEEADYTEVNDSDSDDDPDEEEDNRPYPYNLD